MIDWLFASPSERRLLGEARLRGPTAWVIAIMSFSIVIIGAAGLALANTAGVLTRAIEARYSVEVPAAGGNVEALLGIVRSAPGVASADAVPESEMRHTLERWLGPAAQSSELPVPALVDFDVKPGADRFGGRVVTRKSPGRRSIFGSNEAVYSILEAGCLDGASRRQPRAPGSPRTVKLWARYCARFACSNGSRSGWSSC